MFECETCGTSTCAACEVPYHTGLTCSAYEVSKKLEDKKFAREKAKENIKGLDAQICPTCSVNFSSST